MAENLLPCPFCGGNDIQIDEMESFWDKNETSWRVLCIDCIAETAGDTKEQAIAAWNRRTGKDINVATNNAVPVVRCGECLRYCEPVVSRDTGLCSRLDRLVETDDYCSYGGRR